MLTYQFLELKEASQGDMVVFDPEEEKDIHAKITKLFKRANSFELAEKTWK